VPEKEKEKQRDTYQFYGRKVDALQLKRFVQLNIELNAKAEKRNERRSVICIWGHPGIGKTDIIKQFRNDDYDVRHIPIAQFEEMGDINGMPEIEDGVTVTRPPSWAPQEEKKGILLLDDFNRADLRILKGIMQLLQDYGMVTWQIPKGWTICLTANPEGGDHAVTSLDPAILSRMRHVSLTEDFRAWGRWAESNDVDKRGINFILRYPELLVTGERTNPRTLTEFFRCLEVYPKVNEENMGEIEMLGSASIDEDVVTTFVTFLTKGMLDLIIEPEEILDNFKKQEDKLKKLCKDNRQDILSIISERVFIRITNDKYSPGNSHPENLRAFLKVEEMPKDLRYSLTERIVKSKSSKASMMLVDDKQLVNQILQVV
jgi:hypothetical protein